MTGRGYIRSSPAPRQEASDSHTWVRLRASAQQVVLDRLAASPRVAGLAAALTVGDQAAIQRDDWTLFRLTGVAHLVRIKCTLDQPCVDCRGNSCFKIWSGAWCRRGVAHGGGLGYT